MYRKIISCLAMAAAFSMAAQEVVFTGVLDEAEDTTDVTSITNIIETQEIITSRNTNVAHFNKVWGRNSYFNLSYNKHVALEPKDDVSIGFNGYNNGKVPKFDGDWGAAIMLGHNYRLHKKPIANILAINLDYTFIDLNVNHFNAGDEKYGDDKPLYNSAATWIDIDKKTKKEVSYRYLPWCLEKYEVNYGMMIGPSVTISPFTYINVPGLHYFMVNVYYHIGYHGSILWMKNDDTRDANNEIFGTKYNEDGFNQTGFNEMNRALKLAWGHGLISSFGFSVSWKAIGIGYEVRKGTLKYQPVNTEIFGKNTDKFSAVTSRVYLTIRH